MNLSSRIITSTLAILTLLLPAGEAFGQSRKSRFGTEPATSSMAGDKVMMVARMVADTTNTRFIRNRGFGSMRPVFDTNSVLLVEENCFDSLRIGDIVIFETGGRLISHRIIERRGNRFWTQGDNNARPDSDYVTRENFRYRVWGVLYSNDYALGTQGPGALSDPSAQVADDRDLGAL
jgi:hypothetical protein